MNLVLFLKSLVFGLLLAYVQHSGASLGSVAVFLIITFALYAQPLYATRRHLFGYVFIVGIAILAVAGFSAALPPAALPLVFALLFYILLGIKNVHLAHRQRWYVLLHFALMYAAAILFFSSSANQAYGVKLALGFLVLLLLIRDYFVMQEAVRPHFTAAVSAALAFLLSQALWLISMLPVGFVLAASLFVSLAVILEEIALEYTKSQLTARMIRFYLIAFLVLVALVVAISRTQP